MVPLGKVLEIKENTVLWINNGVLVRKFTFPKGTEISHALFTSFTSSSPSQRNSHGNPKSKEDAVVIVVHQFCHVYYLSGPTFLVNIPRSISKVLKCDRGLILSRNPLVENNSNDSATLPRFFLMSDPLSELGAIVSTSTKSISNFEDMLFFKDIGATNALCLTFDSEKLTLNAYFVRYISPYSSSFAPDVFKPKDTTKRKSARLSSAPFSDMVDSDPLEVSLFNSKNDFSSSNFRDMINIDSSETKSALFSLDSSNALSYRKEVLLTLIDYFHFDSHISNLEQQFFTYNSKYCISIVDTTQMQCVFLHFENNSFPNSVKFQRSVTMNASSVNPMRIQINGIHRDVALVLVGNNSAVLFDPFMEVESHTFFLPQEWGQISKFTCHAGSVYAHSTQTRHKVSISLSPQTGLVSKCMKTLMIALEEHDFVQFNFLWTIIKFSDELFTEWDAFACAVLLLFLSGAIATDSQHSFIAHPENYCNSEQYFQYAKSIATFAPNLKEEEFTTADFHKACLFCLFLVKEDARLDVSLQNEVESLEQLLTHLFAWIGFSSKLPSTLDSQNIQSK